MDQSSRWTWPGVAPARWARWAVQPCFEQWAAGQDGHTNRRLAQAKVQDARLGPPRTNINNKGAKFESEWCGMRWRCVHVRIISSLLRFNMSSAVYVPRISMAARAALASWFFLEKESFPAQIEAHTCTLHHTLYHTLHHPSASAPHTLCNVH